MTIRINALPEATNPAASSFLAVDGATTEKATLQKVVDAGAPVASEAEARSGADNAKRMTALRVKQSIDEEIGNTIASAASGALANTAVQPDSIGSTVQGYFAALQTIGAAGSVPDALLPIDMSPKRFAGAVYVDGGAGSSHVWFRLAGVDRGLIYYDPGGTLNCNLYDASGAQTWNLYFRESDGRFNLPADLAVGGKILVGGSEYYGDGDIKFSSSMASNYGTHLSAALDARVLVTDVGTDVGQIVAREDYQGERAIYTDGGQTVFARRTVGLSDSIDWQFIRVQNTAGPDTTFGFTNSNLVASTVVNATSDKSEWAFLGRLEVNAPSLWAQHCAAYLQALKGADANSWGLAIELRDLVNNPTRGSVAFENGVFVGGTDNNNQRVAVHIPIDRHSSQTGTNHEVARGIWITPDSGNVVVKWGIELKGNFGVGIDLTGMNVAYSDKAIELTQDMLIRWRDGYHGSVEKGAFGWHSAVNTWIFSGVILTSSAPSGGAAAAPPANPVTYVNIQINGTMLKIPAYS